MMRNILIGFIAAGFLALSIGPSIAQSGDEDRGELVYAKRCLQCHGDEGDGLGPAAERLSPPPRDFSLGLFKFKTTAFDEFLSNDADLVRMIRDGMPGTAMPGWGDMLSEQEILDVIAYIKIFADLEGAPEIQMDYGTQIESSPESLAAGQVLFEDGDRCTECHGLEGKGNAIKKTEERQWRTHLAAQPDKILDISRLKRAKGYFCPHLSWYPNDTNAVICRPGQQEKPEHRRPLASGELCCFAGENRSGRAPGKFGHSGRKGRWTLANHAR